MLGYCPPPPNLVSQLMTSRIALHKMLKHVQPDHPEALKQKDSLVSLMASASTKEKDEFMTRFAEWKHEDNVNEAQKVAEDIKRKEDEKNRLAGYLNMKF
jgi:hypothetical protein